MDHDHRSSNTFLVWLTMVIALAALVLAYLAYNRAGEDLETQVEQGIEQTVEQTDDAADDAGEATQEGVDDAESLIDTGPDGVDDGAQ